MSTESTREKKTPFVMFPDNLMDDPKLVRLKRKGGFEYIGLFLQLCFTLHRCREDELEGAMPLDMNDPEAFDDLVYQLNPMGRDQIREAIMLMIQIGLLESIDHNGVMYICAPVMRDAVLNIKRISKLQSDRRKGRNNNTDSEEPNQSSEPMSYTDYLAAIRGVKNISDNQAMRFYTEVVMLQDSSVITAENLKSNLIRWLSDNSS